MDYGLWIMDATSIYNLKSKFYNLTTSIGFGLDT